MKHALFLMSLCFIHASYSQVLIHQNEIAYGTALNWQNQIEDLKLDLIYPERAKHLPLIVNMHGGGFVKGSKERLTKFCEQIAKKGFVVANLEYRKGFDQSPEKSKLGIAQAIYRAQQDESAALRWLIHHAVDYPIDTSWIFIGGESAGAVTSLLSAYISQDEWNLQMPFFHSQLGDLDKTGNELADHYNIKGVISLSGGITDTSLISQFDMRIPVILFHSIDDEVIPYERSTHPDAHFNTLEGSRDIAQRFKNNHACYNLYFIRGAKHGSGFSPDYLAQAIDNFIKTIRDKNCKSSETENTTGDVNKSLFDY